MITTHVGPVFDYPLQRPQMIGSRSSTNGPLAFGHGLYTTFQYSNLETGNAARTVQFQLQFWQGRRYGSGTSIYITFPPSSGEPFQRLVGWQRVQLAPNESQTVIIRLDPAYLSIFDTGSDNWKLLPGEYKVAVGTASDAANSKGKLNLQ